MTLMPLSVFAAYHLCPQIGSFYIKQKTICNLKFRCYYVYAYPKYTHTSLGFIAPLNL